MNIVGVEYTLLVYVLLLLYCRAAYAYLCYRLAYFSRTGHHTGMIVARALIFITHVGVGIKLKDG